MKEFVLSLNKPFLKDSNSVAKLSTAQSTRKLVTHSKELEKSKVTLGTNSKKALIQRFKKMFRNVLCKIMKEHKLSSDQIIYEEESLEDISGDYDSED